MSQGFLYIVCERIYTVSFAISFWTVLRHEPHIFNPKNFCKFGFCRRRVLILEWLRLAARIGFFVHKSHFGILRLI